MKKVKLVTFCLLFVSSLFAQTIRDHRSFAWKLLPGGAGKDVCIDDLGNVYMVNSAGKLSYYNSTQWEEMENSNLGTIAMNDGDGIKVYSNGKMSGKFMSGGIHWHPLLGSDAKDVAINLIISGGLKYRSHWMVNTAGKIYYYSNLIRWEQIPGSDAARIAAGGGQVWMVNTVGKIYRHKNSRDPNAGWEQMPGSDGRDITVGNDGSVWLVNTAGKIYRWYGTGWTQQPGSDGNRIAVNKGKVVLINTAGKIYIGEY